MLTDDDCRAIREALMSRHICVPTLDDVRELVRAINAMPDGPVWVVPREASDRMQHIGGACLDYPNVFMGGPNRQQLRRAKIAFQAMAEAGAAEVRE